MSGRRTMSMSNFSISISPSSAVSSTLLVQHPLRFRKVEGESGDGALKAPPRGIDHPIFADHQPARRGQRAARGVFERLPRRDRRLLADDAGAAHLLLPAIGVGDAPVA